MSRKKKRIAFKMIHTLQTVSDIDGRYFELTECLSPYLSEMALMKYRFLVEVEYLIALNTVPAISTRNLTNREISRLRSWVTNFSLRDAEIIKRIEITGYGKAIRNGVNHDLNSIVRYLQRRMKRTSMQDMVQWVHFPLTSEDVINIAYALLLGDLLTELVIPELESIHTMLRGWAIKYKDLPMLYRTHNQPASPGTMGKTFNTFAYRLRKQLDQLWERSISVKLNGSTGNYNAHYVAFPDVDWISFTYDFIHLLNIRALHRGWGQLKLVSNMVTDQTEDHDTLAEMLDNLKRINTILIKLCRDVWDYIGDEWIVQLAIKGEDGSSVMPNKVNPINFENAEGNLEFDVALLEFFSRMLPLTRKQRHLSDSTVQRKFGISFGCLMIACSNIEKGLGRSKPNPIQMIADLQRRPEIISEAIQIVLRKEGIVDAYDQLKAFTRGKPVTQEMLRDFVRGFKINARAKHRLLMLTPENYTGVAAILAEY